MSNIKELIIGAITVMSDDEANKLWNVILKKYNQNWENIEEVDPDEQDLKMLDEIKKDPECKKFD